MKTEKRNNVITVWIDIKGGWEQWLMLRSDTHHDSVNCRRDLELKQLQKARERNALILDGGDLFDAMQGRFDPRRNYTDIRPEYLKDNKYYDNVLEDCAQFYKPYARQFLMLARGNHERSVLKNAQTDLTDRLVDRLNSDGGNVLGGAYGGWVKFVFTTNITRHYTGKSLNIKYFHGAGGEAPVTRGVIQTNRQAVYLPDADIVWNGHSHNDYLVDVKRERLSKKGNLSFDIATFVRTPGYKDDYGEGADGWEVERGGVPKPHGCAWIRLSWDGDNLKREITLDVE